MKTGGKGSRGNGGGPDALFSQDSVLVSHGNLFVVNVRHPTKQMPLLNSSRVNFYYISNKMM
jgi:hypothetical protein